MSESCAASHAALKMLMPPMSEYDDLYEADSSFSYSAVNSDVPGTIFTNP